MEYDCWKKSWNNTLKEKLGNEYLISSNFGVTQEFGNYYYAVQCG